MLYKARQDFYLTWILVTESLESNTNQPEYVSDHYERKGESLESKRVIRRIDQEDNSENLGNTFLIID